MAGLARHGTSDNGRGNRGIGACSAAKGVRFAQVA